MMGRKKELTIPKAIKTGNASAQWENDGEGWTTSWINGPGTTYEDYFKPVFKTPFREFLQSRESLGRGRFVLDLMSPGWEIRSLPLERGLAVSLGDGRTGEQRAEMDAKNIDLITGNILQAETWKTIDAWLADHGRKSFDFIVSRPDMTGYYPEYIPSDMRLYFNLLNKAWRILSDDDGVLLTQVDSLIQYPGENVVSVYEMQAWLALLKEKGIEYSYSPKHALMLKRSKGSPQNLPSLSQLPEEHLDFLKRTHQSE